jgi:hypothetical protein
MTTRITVYLRRNVLGLIAIFIALSSGAYAAGLARDSVKSKQIKAGAVKSAEVADGSLLDDDFVAGQLPRGATGPEGPRGAQGADGTSDTAAQVLAKLLTVDGAGSTLSSDAVDGFDSKDFARLGGVVNGDGTVSHGTGFTVSKPGTGEYQIAFPNGTLSAAHCPPIPAVLPFTGLHRTPEITGLGCSGLGAGSFTIKILDSAGAAQDTAFAFMAM